MRQIVKDLVATRLGIDGTRNWMRTPNPALKGWCPDEYFLVGKEKDLIRIVWHMLGYPT